MLDCSNGAFSEIIIDSLGKRENIHLVETQPNGLNINLNCGALEGERLLKLVRNGNHQFGALLMATVTDAFLLVDMVLLRQKK